jgi:hypothetical protein
VEENIEETLTDYRLPLSHHKHMKSPNMLERLNQEIKRRTHVVRIFPNTAGCLRLVRALAVEIHEEWLETSRYLTWSTCASTKSSRCGQRHNGAHRSKPRAVLAAVKPVEQLGSDKLEVRLGGIYSLERISKESPDDYWTVMENLTAFVRERSRRNEAERTALDLEQRVSRRAYFLRREAGQPGGREEDFWAEAVKREELGERPTADIAAVLTVMKWRSGQSREREASNGWRLDLSGAILKRADLSGAHLEAANLSAVDFEWADLSDAHLEGAALGGAHLERTRLSGAHLKDAFLWYAHFEGAYLWHTHLEGTDLVNTGGLVGDQLLDAYADAWTKLPPGLVRPTHWPEQRDRDQPLRDAMVRFFENAGESVSRNVALMASLKALWHDLNPPEVSGNGSAGSPANGLALPAGPARRAHTGPAPPA